MLVFGRDWLPWRIDAIFECNFSPAVAPDLSVDERRSTLMRRRAARASQVGECCRRISASQFWRALARTNRAHNPAAQCGLLSCEHVLDAGANFAPVAVAVA